MVRIPVFSVWYIEPPSFLHIGLTSPDRDKEIPETRAEGSSTFRVVLISPGSKSAPLISASTTFVLQPQPTRSTVSVLSAYIFHVGADAHLSPPAVCDGKSAEIAAPLVDVVLRQPLSDTEAPDDKDRHPDTSANFPLRLLRLTLYKSFFPLTSGTACVHAESVISVCPYVQHPCPFTHTHAGQP